MGKLGGDQNGFGDPASKEKLVVGCAFYGYNKDGSGNTLWGNVDKVPYADYSGGGNYNPGDLPQDVADKVNHCYTQGYGGVMFWRMDYDVAVNDPNTPSLLKAIWTANETKGGYILSCAACTACTAPTQTYTTSPVSGSGLKIIDNGCGSIIIQNVTVNNDVTLKFISCGNITVNNVTAVSGAKLILDAGDDVIINEIDIQLGAEFEIQ